MKNFFKFKLILFISFFTHITLANDLPKCVGSDVKEFNNCLAKVRYSDGSTYEGSFKNGMRDGFGKFQFQNGETYEGSYKDNKTEGIGKGIYENGDTYEGSYREGKREGFGKYIFKNGNIYEGMEGNNNANGKGKLTFSNGNYIESDFVDGKANGEGKYFKDGKLYTTIFSNGKAADLVELKNISEIVEQDKQREEKEVNNPKDADKNTTDNSKEAFLNSTYLNYFIDIIGFLFFVFIIIKIIKSKKFSLSILKIKELFAKKSQILKTNKNKIDYILPKLKNYASKFINKIKVATIFLFSYIKSSVNFALIILDTKNKLSTQKKDNLANFISYGLIAIVAIKLFNLYSNIETTYKDSNDSKSIVSKSNKIYLQSFVCAYMDDRFSNAAKNLTLTLDASLERGDYLRYGQLIPQLARISNGFAECVNHGFNVDSLPQGNKFKFAENDRTIFWIIETHGIGGGGGAYTAFEESK